MMKRVFVDENGNKHDLDKTDNGSEHGAAQNFDYLLSTGTIAGTGEKEAKAD